MTSQKIQMRVSEKDHRGLYTFFFVEFKPSPVASFSHLRWPANRHTELCLRRHARYLRQPGARVIDEICIPAFATPNACHHPPTPTQSTDGTCCPLQMRRMGALAGSCAPLVHHPSAFSKGWHQMMIGHPLISSHLQGPPRFRSEFQWCILGFSVWFCSKSATCPPQ